VTPDREVAPVPRPALLTPRRLYSAGRKVWTGSVTGVVTRRGPRDNDWGTSRPGSPRAPSHGRHLSPVRLCRSRPRENVDAAWGSLGRPVVVACCASCWAR
jgi:hypothetical protein